MPKPKALLFDCDNTLVLSEDLAFEGGAALVNRLLAQHGVRNAPVFTGKQLMTEYVGQNFRVLLANLQKEYGFSLSPAEVDTLVASELDNLVQRIETPGELKPCVGVHAALERVVAKTPEYTLAVVSSSALSRVNASLKATSLEPYFADRVYSAATSLPVPTSKPDPAIYKFALDKLGVKPHEAVATEDSRSGTTSAVAAGIPTIGYLGPYEGDERDEMARVLTDAGARVLMLEWSGFERALEELAALG
ncbi:Phosphorylated carbohydrates phosphatase [Vanrija pseudolonga]|uniref:Phosphorylated carbohydrates phosphatase n=1 Tax=Vanrija pseudolonga TaxID=143232 RepID=A0AAF0YG82_9TREE|nr:Phosphorylated carbohydrates phosphatase [Vanrija pseudolonga]